MPDTEFPDWMDKTGVGVIGQFTLIDGKQLVAEISSFDEETNDLLVHVISGDHSRGSASRTDRPIHVSSVVDFAPQPRAAQPWPYSDPCRNGSFSLSRFVLMSALFVSLTAGSLFIFMLFLTGEPYRLQLLSAISYTLFELFFTFAAARDLPRYLFSCPAVRSQIPQLLRRHAGFLTALFLLQSAALAIEPHLPGWWSAKDKKGGTLFETTLLLTCITLGYIQVFTSRSLLKRAHSSFST